MLKNYFLVAWRGLAVCMLIALYVTHELSYDRYHVNADRIYRLDADLQVGAMGY
jgi:putative ABC transport system permease protein